MDDIINMINIVVEAYNNTFQKSDTSNILDLLNAGADAANRDLITYCGDDQYLNNLLSKKINFTFDIYYSLFYDDTTISEVPNFYIESYKLSMLSTNLDLDNLSLDDPIFAPLAINLSFDVKYPVRGEINVDGRPSDHVNNLLYFKPVITYAILTFGFNFKKINQFIIATVRACVRSTSKVSSFYNIEPTVVNKINNNFIKQNIEVPNIIIFAAYNQNFIDKKLLKKLKLKYLYQYDVDSKNMHGDPDDDDLPPMVDWDDLISSVNNTNNNDDAGPLDGDWGDDDGSYTNKKTDQNN